MAFALLATVGATLGPRPVRGQAGAVVRPPGGRTVTKTAAPRTDTLNALPPEVHPRARYGSFRAACDGLERQLRGTLGVYGDSARFARERAPFTYPDDVRLVIATTGQPIWEMVSRDTAAVVPSLHVTLTTRSERAPGNTQIQEALERAGWLMDLISADGPNGTVQGWVCREALCVVEAHWDAAPEDEADSSVVVVPGEQIDILCVPRPLSHPYRSRADASQ
jgi:hypothetical protein